LGRFYAEYRNLGKALEIFEKHLSIYHDQSIAIQCAEIYCLLNRIDKISALQKDYQSDAGTWGMLCNYYLEALTALAKKDIVSLKEHAEPLRKNIDTPLSAFMFLCVDAQYGDLRSVQDSYNTLLAHRNYLNLQEQADNILADFLKKSFASGRTQDKFVLLATQLYARKKDAAIAKIILLAQKSTNSINPGILHDAVKRFGDDPGVIKLAIEYYLSSDLTEAEKLIVHYKQQFASRANETLRYEIVLNTRKENNDKVSELFQKNISPEILPAYWAFVSSTMREADLIFLSKNKLYEPYCKALLLLKQQKNQQAAAVLKDAEANNDPALLFFAAKILAENGYHQDALKRYGQIPDSSPLQLTVLLNMAEIYAELGDLDQSLILANRAYTLAPQMPEAQLCYADKLHKKGKHTVIPEIINLSTHTPLRRRMESLWIIGMQHCIKECNINTQKEKIRELCRRLLVISPDNNIALEYLKKLHMMPQ
jgi:tetratricopeptide (TPR) repeat protein